MANQGPKDITFRFKLRGTPTAPANPTVRVLSPTGTVTIIPTGSITKVTAGQLAPDGKASDDATYTTVVTFDAPGPWKVEAFADGGITSPIASFYADPTL